MQDFFHQQYVDLGCFATLREYESREAQIYALQVNARSDGKEKKNSKKQRHLGRMYFHLFHPFPFICSFPSKISDFFGLWQNKSPVSLSCSPSLNSLGFDKKNTCCLRLKPVRSWFGASASILARTCHVTPCAPEVSVKIILRQTTSAMSAMFWRNTCLDSGWEFLPLVNTTQYRDFEGPSSWGNHKVRSCRNQYPGENMSWCQGRNHPKGYFM